MVYGNFRYEAAAWRPREIAQMRILLWLNHKIWQHSSTTCFIRGKFSFFPSLAPDISPAVFSLCSSYNTFRLSIMALKRLKLCKRNCVPKGKASIVILKVFFVCRSIWDVYHRVDVHILLNFFLHNMLRSFISEETNVSVES